MAVFFEQVFAGEFCFGVRGFRLGWHRLELRHRRVVAVDGGGRRQDDFAGAGGQGGGKHTPGAFGVEFSALGRFGDGLRHGDHRGEVVDFLGAGHGLRESGFVEDRALEETATDPFQIASIATA